MEILGAILIALLVFLGLALATAASWSVWQFYKVLRELRDQIRALNSNLNGVPVLLDGIKGICAELAGNTLKMSSSAEALKKSLLADETSDHRRSPGVQNYDDESADREYMRRIVEQNEALAAVESGRFIVGE